MLADSWFSSTENMTFNIKVIFFEELTKSPVDFAQELCHKLDVELEDTSHDLSKKVNASRAPVNYFLSRIVYNSVNLMHNLGLHKIVEYGKILGIKKFITSKKSKKSQVNNEDFIHVFDLLKQDIMMLETDL